MSESMPDRLPLDPCPFCGGTNIGVEFPTDYVSHVFCSGCGACGPEDTVSQVAEVRWNKRKNDNRESLIRELVGVLEPLATRMQSMIDIDMCDCEDSHVCGRPQAQREVKNSVAVLAKAKECLNEK